MYEKLRFLVVDDNASVRMIIKEILRGLGAPVVELAGDGKSALALLRAQPFDVLITDMVMPGFSGIDLARTIRRGGAITSTEIPIIMLSGNIDRAALITARDAGVSEFVAKPVVVANLQARLEASVCRPRSFVTSSGYTGPCRRRNALPFPMADRRR
jgi:two-component system chemotaxis response regulator CheY